MELFVYCQLIIRLFDFFNKREQFLTEICTLGDSVKLYSICSVRP
jgi:hypothetical protein